MFKLKINNFRGFNNSIISINNTNILIGENSGGKSSLIKLLLLLKQSMETINIEKKIIVNGHFIDLGNFDNFIQYNSNQDSFSISITTDEEYLLFFLNILIPNENQKKRDLITKKCSGFILSPITLTFTFDKKNNEYFNDNISIYSEEIGTLNIEVKDKKQSAYSMNDLDGILTLNHKKKGSIKIESELTVHGFLLLADGSKIKDYADNIKDETLYEEFAFLLLTQNYFTYILKGIKYLNPMNFIPERISLKRDESNIIKISNYQTLINSLLTLKKSPLILEKFNSAISELGIADEIQLSDESSVVELKAKVRGNWSNIMDVGFGVALQIPIILQAIISAEEDENHLIIIEQPEIHLHPALHAKFIEVLLKYVGDNKIIIETHSEHIIRKLQVLVKNKQIKNSSVSINYFKNDNGKFHITEHNMLDNGQLKEPFPKGFYDNSYNLSKELY